MHMLKSAAAMAAIVLFAAGCDSSPSEPTFVSAEAAVESALIGAGDAVDDGSPRPAILARLTWAAIAKIGHEEGRDSAQAALAALRPYFVSFRAALQTRDTVAVRTAFQALRQAEAELIVSTLGADVVLRALEFAHNRITRLDQAIAAAITEGRDPARLQEMAARLHALLDEADADAAAGDYTAALIAAADVIGALHMRTHFGPGR